MFKHVIWDFDGTLYDTYPAMTHSLKIVLAMRGITESDARIYSHLKVTTADALRHYRAKYSLDDSLDRDFAAVRRDIEKHMCLPYPGMLKLLSDINASGGFNYISTNRSGATLRIILEHQGVVNLFRDIVSVDDGLPRKPEPALITHILEKYALEPAETIMVGDRELDIVAGHRAGIRGAAYSDGAGSPIQCADFTAVDVDGLRSILLD